MTIGILGAGHVGGALARRCIEIGERVHFGVPDPAKYAALARELGADVGAPAQAVQASDVVILATPYEAAVSAVGAIGDWDGRILVDATNPLAPGLAGLSIGTTTSAAEEIARAARGARVVKAFNSTGFENMLNPHFPGGAALMPVCGDDDAARERVISLARAMGFDAVDFGPLLAARYLEPLAMAWIHLAFRQGYGREFAFGLLRR